MNSSVEKNLHLILNAENVLSQKMDDFEEVKII